MNAALVQGRAFDLTKPVRRRGRIVATTAILALGAAAGILWIWSFSRGRLEDGSAGTQDGAVGFRTGGFEGWFRPGAGVRLRMDGDTATLVAGDAGGGTEAALRFLYGDESAGSRLDAWVADARSAGADSVVRRSRRIGALGRHRAEEAIVRDPGVLPRLRHRLALPVPGGVLLIEYAVPEHGGIGTEDAIEAALATLDWS